MEGSLEQLNERLRVDSESLHQEANMTARPPEATEYSTETLQVRKLPGRTRETQNFRWWPLVALPESGVLTEDGTSALPCLTAAGPG